ncbi:Cof-type HAD-IIB family hydrolase [Paenibacillus mucilaginosus]|uniref:Phosphatase n=2 Tax=Paenibacillus mucilaginosus TaxID=61624 RepID=I0BVA6_9BACL|nr:Cof-type HAD-IIB family hydrolase [Paenibacillus mucilaginosus]AEI46374.1 Cof-like hydrolase [Paenibacillus mucilaginosus KNP414]AFH66303.1 phosphatase [Paenibacillus mucilaginosus K02]MCG7213513.1 Cof-type HAD-IIB family hydrolase [Paenibacillus mucilaginosus]WDM27671.1 Cof-type HAD-IIB family hydrolase [Paenibacillus mucilaginosus]WFA22344.1 Cof-type HAD-IIB family hydrolase [Paenibacillus mucilaginosus]
MSYKIVFFDIDGTLVNEEKVVPQDTIDAVRELKASGVEPVIATGRAPYFFRPLLEQLGLESFVSLNGAYVVYKGEALYSRVIPKTSLQLLVEHAAKNNHALVFQSHEAFFTNSQEHQHVFDSVASLKVNQPGYDPDYWKTADIYQAFLHCSAEEEALYKDVLADLQLVRWHPSAMDVLPVGGSKAQGIQALLAHLGIPPEEAVAFGDGLNDKEMLKYVGLGIAMGNSNPELLPYADFVTAHVDESGIRKGLEHAGLLPAASRA